MEGQWGQTSALPIDYAGGPHNTVTIGVETRGQVGTCPPP